MTIGEPVQTDTQTTEGLTGQDVQTMFQPERQAGARRGARREEGAPSGPEEVRRAPLDAAASLFAERGMDHVALRDSLR